MLKMTDEGVWRVMTSTAAAATLGVLTGTPRWHAVHHVTGRSGHIGRRRCRHRRRSIFWNAIRSDNDDDYEHDDDDNDINFQDNVYKIIARLHAVHLMNGEPFQAATDLQTTEWVTE